MIDSNDIIRGSGPMTPTRAGDVAYAKVIDLAYSGEYTKKQLMDRLNKNGGLTDIFGTADAREVKKMGEQGNYHAKIVYDGMIYQNAKYAGAMAVALKGKVDAVILTGGMANDTYFTDKMKEYLSGIAEVVVSPGDFELEALGAGALRVVRGEEEAMEYTGVPVWDGFGA
jgi:butyrate kinase